MPKYTPKTKDELKALVRDNSIYLGDIDTSNITDMSYLFNYLFFEKFFLSERTDFSGIENWNVSNVADMQGMFSGCKNFNQDISSWDVSNVENMSEMFDDCENFNQDLSSWNVGKVEDMEMMFLSCFKFNQDLSSWDVSKVKNMSAMFDKCKNFNQDLSSWNVSKVKDMSYMFAYCYEFNQPLDKWDVSDVKNMNGMFKDAKITQEQAFSGELKFDNAKITQEQAFLYKLSLDEINEYYTVGQGVLNDIYNLKQEKANYDKELCPNKLYLIKDDVLFIDIATNFSMPNNLSKPNSTLYMQNSECCSIGEGTNFKRIYLQDCTSLDKLPEDLQCDALFLDNKTAKALNLSVRPDGIKEVYVEGNLVELLSNSEKEKLENINEQIEEKINKMPLKMRK